MNIYQRVTLVVGAIVAVVVYSAPTTSPYGTPYYELREYQGLLLSRVALVLIVTGLVWFALQGFRPDTIGWVHPPKWTKRVYLVFWAAWLSFGVFILSRGAFQEQGEFLFFLIFILIPAGLYVLPRIIIVYARWAGWGVKEGENKGGGKG